MRGWTVSAGSALAVVALIGGGAFAANTLGDEPAPAPDRQQPASEPVQLLEVSDEQVTITQPEPAPEPVVEVQPAPEPATEAAPAPAPEPVVEEEPVVTPKPEPMPAQSEAPYHSTQGNNPDAPPVAPNVDLAPTDEGGNQAPVGD